MASSFKRNYCDGKDQTMPQKVRSFTDITGQALIDIEQNDDKPTRIIIHVLVKNPRICALYLLLYGLCPIFYNTNC